MAQPQLPFYTVNIPALAPPQDAAAAAFMAPVTAAAIAQNTPLNVANAEVELEHLKQLHDHKRAFVKSITGNCWLQTMPAWSRTKSTPARACAWMASSTNVGF
jgi:hypothetical protein